MGEMARVMGIYPFCKEKFQKQGLPMHSSFCQANLNRGSTI